MPIDNYTKDFFRHIRSQLGTVVARIDTLIGIADRQKRDDTLSLNDEKATSEKDYATVGRAVLGAHIIPPQHHDKIPHNKWYKTLKGWKTFTEIVGIIAAIVYAGISYMQWRDANRNFKAGQRPWVGVVYPLDVDHETFFDPIESDKSTSFHYRFKNYGNSPALHVRQHGHGWIEVKAVKDIDWETVKQTIESLPLVENVEGTIFSGAEFSPEPGPSEGVLESKDVDQINSGNFTVILGGRIEYLDAFEGTTHHTTWCIRYVPPSPEKFPGWRSCPIINKAD